MAPSTAQDNIDAYTFEAGMKHDQPEASEPNNNIAAAFRGNEIPRVDIFTRTQEALEDFPTARVEQLMSAMNNYFPSGGLDISYGDKDTQYLRF